jgi:hypothetical protein
MDFCAMPVVKLLREVFFQRSMPGLTTNTAKQEALRRLQPDFDPAAEVRALLDKPEIQADPRCLMNLRGVVECREEIHDREYGRAARAMEWLDQTGIQYELKLHTRSQPRHNAIRVTVSVKLGDADAAMFKLYWQ